MAVTKQTYTANGSTTQFTIPFEYIARADVDVYIDTVLQGNENVTTVAAAAVGLRTGAVSYRPIFLP